MKLCSCSPLILVPAVLWGCQRPEPRPADLAIVDITIVDVEHGRPVPGSTVLIRGNRISEVGPSGQTRVAPGTHVIRGEGKHLIPGLWDMHVHTGPKEVFLPLYIANGITGIRDTGGDLPKATGNASLSLDEINEWKKQIERGELIGPRIVATGPIIDGPKPYWPGVTTPVQNEAEARQLVRDLKRRNADFIKVYETLPRGTYYAIADESKKNRLPFAGHVPKSMTAAEVSRAGQKCIEHLDGVLEYDPASSRALHELFRSNGTWHVPTLVVARSLVTNDDSFLADDRLKYMPGYIQRIWRKSWWHAPCPQEQVARRREQYRRREKAVKEMYDAGVGILAGSDSANPYTYPGFSLHDELERLVQAGLTPAQALRTATLNPARFLGRHDSLGTVEAGKIADLVLLDADPLEDIGNTRRISGVVVNGRHLAREQLQDMLARAAAASRDARYE